MHINGRCHCGQITYTAEIDPATVGICNCTDCQTLSGSPWRASVPAPAESFKLLTGHPNVYVKTGGSGKRRVQAFCPDCGTPIYSSAVSEPETYVLRIGAIVERAQLNAPRGQIWKRSALPWAQDISGVPARDTD